MTSKQEFGIGLIGLGIGQQHLLGYQAQGLRIAAICDKDTERLNEVGERFQIDKRYTRIADLIADADVDVVDMQCNRGSVPLLSKPLPRLASIFSAKNRSQCRCNKPLKWWRYVSNTTSSSW